MAFSGRRIIAVILAPTGIVGAARAQLIGPIPPATPPTPGYVSPDQRAAPPVPRVDVPETAPLAPTIVAKDAQGRLKPLTGTAEEAAVAAYPFATDQRPKIDAARAARSLDMDRFVVEKLDMVLAARRMREKVEQASEFSRLFEARDITASLRFERLIDRLERDGAITLAQRIRIDEALLRYERARKEQIDVEAGGDATRAAILNLRQTFADATREPFRSLDAQANDVADHLRELKDRLSLRPDQIAMIDAVGTGPDAHEKLRAIFLETLDMEQRRAAMTARLAARGQEGAKR